MINDFAMHLIIFKWPRRQKSRQKRKTMRQKEVKTKKETVYEKVSFNYVLDFSLK